MHIQRIHSDNGNRARIPPRPHLSVGVDHSKYLKNWKHISMGYRGRNPYNLSCHLEKG